MSETGYPEFQGELGNSHGHELEAVEGSFHDLVWRCLDCGKERIKKEYFLNVDCR